MTRGFEIPKATPESVARAMFDGVERGEDDISRFERRFAAFVDPLPMAA